MSFGIYHRTHKSVVKLCEIKRSKRAALRFAAESAEQNSGTYIVVDYDTRKEILHATGIN